jgi:hypothetical protein
MGSKRDVAHDQFMHHSHKAIDKFRAAKQLAQEGTPSAEIDSKTLSAITMLLAEARREMDRALSYQEEFLAEKEGRGE